MNRKSFFILGSIALSSMGNAGCSPGDNRLDAPGEALVEASTDAPSDASVDAAIICPSCDELLTWDSTVSDHTTYGGITTDSTWSDSYAWQMLDACPGWSINEGHEGGIGDTLEIGTCEGGVVLVWIGDRFSAFQLSQGWTGKTDTGFGVGSSYEDFIKAYPDYESDSMLIDKYGIASMNYTNGLVFFDNGLLSEFLVF
ncbi:MAG: hypothetical protein WCT54_01475 [Patescibacteria group bacterium]